MAVICSKCGKEYDVSLFQFGRSVTCDCGQIVSLEGGDVWAQIKAILSEAEEDDLRALQRMADRVSSLIIASDYQEVDIELEIEKVREKCLELFPDKMELFGMIYESRFRRLWEQFRRRDGG